MAEEEALSIWVVYDHPTDWPRYFVARRHVAYGEQAGPTESVILDVDLARLRRALMVKGLTRLDRMPGDDPVIMETWL
jgi:hypothetical protein